MLTQPALHRYLKRGWLSNSLLVETTAELLDCNSTALSGVLAEPGRHYRHFEKPKSSGGFRLIHVPSKAIRELQSQVLTLLYRAFRRPAFLHGGIPERSTRTFALPHVRKQMVATLDICNFFPSVQIKHVTPVFEAMKLSPTICDDLIGLTMLDGGLPQGAVTSTFLANLAFLPVDLRLLAICKRHRLDYGRFVDDIAISGQKDFSELRGPFRVIIEQADFELSAEKTHFRGREQRQMIAGLVLNDELRPAKEFRRSLKADIDLCRDVGVRVYAALEGLNPHRGKASLNGRVRYLQQFDPCEGERLRRKLYDIDWSVEKVLHAGAEAVSDAETVSG